MAIEQIGYILLALLGLSFLVFIHELGHYIVALRNGMRVETFSIGFGKPIWSTMINGVKWQVGILPFGGFVKIAGMEREKGKDPHEIPDGFYGRGPWARIKVALAGPVVNILFAVFAFTLLWAIGGRIKPFSEFTTYLGSIDPKSELYAKGVRPGAQLTSLNNAPYKGINDILFASVINGRPVEVEGYKIEYLKGRKTPFEYTLTPYPLLNSLIPEMTTIGIQGPAAYLIYEKNLDGTQNVLYEGSPMFDSGIQYGDRIVWADDELVFSEHQLSKIVNDQRALLTVKRGQHILQIKVPRVPVTDIRLTPDGRAEFEDWAHETKLQDKQYLFIPYNISHALTIEHPYTYINENSEPETPDALHSGDRILAIDGHPVSDAYEFFREVQTKQVSIIIDRGSSYEALSWKRADTSFEEGTHWKELSPLLHTFGTENKTVSGRFHRLKAVSPIAYRDFPLSEEKKAGLATHFDEQLQKIQEIKDPKQREAALRQFEQLQSRLMLGISLQDRQIRYNPNPLELTTGVLAEMKKTFFGLFSGQISPKYLAGPVGIVSMIQHSWSQGFADGLYWLGLISLNLAILNLLPLPVLDGGHIVFSLIEAIRRKPIKLKTMERIIIPFVAILIAFFIYITFHDIARLFGRFF